MGNNSNIDQAYLKAKEILSDNTVLVTANNKEYRRIIPSKEFYVHQWNWDSATHAMGLVYVDESLAFSELLSLVSGQWENGLLPQITFNPNEKKYFPGPQFWGTESFKRGEILTSGLTQPPLLGVAVEHVYRNATDRVAADAFLDEILPYVKKYHEYLQTFRDPENSGLLTIVHPWESGTDNAPRFDLALEKIELDSIPESIKATVRTNRTDDKEGDATHRPRLHDYFRYMYLVSLFRSWNWDYKKIVAESPFAMKDILVSSIWCRSNRVLASLLKDKGDTEGAKQYETLADQTHAAIQVSWDPASNLFRDIDVSLGKHEWVTDDAITSFLPLYANAVTNEQAGKLLQKLTDPKHYWTELPVPSSSVSHPKFDIARYWRGPTWPITNLFIIDGLSHYLSVPRAEEIRNVLVLKTLDVIATEGFSEYFDPTLGHSDIADVKQTLGFGSFSWTAAIFLYLYHTYATIESIYGKHVTK